MNDSFNYVGNDLVVSATGDILQTDSTVLGQQRILRRLLTNPTVRNTDGTIEQGDYIFHGDYGAGLPRWIGKVLDKPKITALIRGQMLMEDAVAKQPEPQIEIEEIPNGIMCTIRYNDALTNASQTLSFNVNA